MSENKSLSQSLNIDKRKALDTIKKILDDNDIGYRISNTESINWINNIPSPVWGYDLGIHVDELLRANQVLRSALDPLGFTTGMDNYNNAIWIKQKPVINEYNIYNDFVEYIAEEAEYSEINHYPVFIILQHNGTRLGNIIKKVTKDEYTHACISFNSALSPIYSFGLKKGEKTGKENGSGLVIQSGPTAPFYLERKSTYSIYVMYVNKEQYENMQKTLKWFVKRRDKIGFDIPSLILNWLEKPSEKSKKYFCSRFVAEIINAGYKLDKVPSLWRPEDFKSLSNITLVDKGNDFKKYSKEIVDNNIELVKEYRYNFIKFNESVEEKEVYDPLGSTLMTNNEVPFDLPDIEAISKPDITTLLNNTPEDRIFLTSDWHFFKNHYKKEHNYVNTRDILDWCRKNIKEDDVFIYLGDLSFRYANKLDQAKSQEYMSSIKGHKIFVLGNHDKMLGSDYFTKCGFDYVVEEFSWRNYIFTHRPVNMSTFPSDWINIHGHIHNIRKYNTTDGKRNVNVYPYFFDNKPTTFKYVSTHVEELVKDNEWNWNAGYGEAAISSTSYINESNIDEYKYYHLSKESDLSIVEPSIPDNYMTKNKFEDHKTKRVCFAPSINQCLMAMSRNLTGETFYVYTLYESDYKKIKKPSVNQVPDVNITGEVWITDSVKVKYIGKIRVTGVSTNDGYSYMYGDDKKHKAELYDWDYTVVAENYMSNANILNYIKEQTALINKPKSLVYYSNFVDSKIIAYMVSLFRNRLGSRVAIKLHFGEDGNTNFLNPKYLKDLVKITNGALVDSNTAYAGSTRGDTQSHIATARKHGFGFGYIDILDADGEINLGVPKRFKIQQDMDDLAFGRKKSYELPVTNGVHLQEISVGSHIKNYDSMVVYTHFKGHDVAGYGGSIKNIGMGIPSKNGKLQIHGKNFEVSGPLFLERLVESASAIESIFDGRVVYVNILQNMSTKCDCDKDAPKAKIPDVGVLVSDNIVAIEQASIDFIRNSPKNKDLMEQISNRGGTHQIEYADYLGMGNRQYILKNVHNNERLQLENTSVVDEISDYSKVSNENYVLPMPDIKYNKEKFDSGKTNLLFITGLSGAGKSTLSLDIGDDCEVVPLDAVIWNKTYINLDEIKQISPMAFEFFNGEGNKYYVSMKQLKNNGFMHKNYMKDLICNFIDFAIRYAKDHKDQKYVIEGVYIYECIDPKLLKDYAVYIKGTSAITSLVRAGKRDNKLINNILKPGFWLSDEPRLNKFRKYFMALMKSHKESVLLSTNESEMINENIIISRNDISYRISQFSSGEVNKCMIVGFSGSGKTTISKSIVKTLDNCELYELDDLISNWDFSDKNLKEYGDLIYSFFQNPKYKKYRLSKYEELEQYEETEYELPLIKDFIDYTNEYAKSHTDKRIILEGIWCPYFDINPNEFKDWAVIVKGTSYLTSEIRATNRNLEGQPLVKRIRNFLHNQSPERIKNNSIHMMRGVDKWYNYFKKLNKIMITESNIKRSELPDSAFGIPEDRKFPLDTEKHVRSAIHLFGHAEESKKKNLAHRIASAAKKYGITIPETTQCYKYLNEGALFDIIPQDRDTIIFDMGNVLVDAHTIDALLNNPDIPDEYVYDIRDFIYEHFFYNETNKHEIQQYTIPQAKAYYMKNAPEHIKAYVDSVFDTFKPAMFTYDYAYDMLEFFRSRGYKLYYLSNWDRYSYECEKEFFVPLLSKFDGGLFSFQTPYIKPELNIYTKLLKDYNIIPEKAVFFDDRQENLDVAKMLGIYPVKFDKNVTPKQIMGDAIIIPKDTDNILLVSTDRGLDSVNIHSITWWYICENRYPSEVDEELYYKSLEDCVRVKYDTLNSNNAFTDEYPYVEEYVFINSFCIDKNKVPKLCPVGKILIYASGGYEWEIQYPLRFENGEFKSIKEYAMNAVNPIIGITKPYVLIAQDSKGIQRPVLSPDMENDKYLTVNENGKFSIVKSNRYTIKAIYEFVGNPAYIDRLSYRYKDKNYISEGIYTELTGKDLLSIDQFDTDPSFKKIDVDLLEQKAISEVVTLKHQIKKYTNRTIYNHPLIESYMTKIPEFVHKYNKFGDIKLMEDFDGVYFYSTLTEKRSGSVATPSLLTENMLKAIL